MIRDVNALECWRGTADEEEVVVVGREGREARTCEDGLNGKSSTEASWPVALLAMMGTLVFFLCNTY